MELQNNQNIIIEGKNFKVIVSSSGTVLIKLNGYD